MKFDLGSVCDAAAQVEEFAFRSHRDGVRDESIENDLLAKKIVVVGAGERIFALGIRLNEAGFERA